MRIAIIFKNLDYGSGTSNFYNHIGITTLILGNQSPETLSNLLQVTQLKKKKKCKASMTNLQSLASLPCYTLTTSQCWQSIWYVGKTLNNIHSLPLFFKGFSILTYWIQIILPILQM